MFHVKHEIMEKLKNCLVCGSEQQSIYLKCIDYLVSKNEFSLVQCDKCGFVYTNPRPAIEEIGSYYKSEKYYSHSDDNKSIVSRVYNTIRKINIKRKLSLLDQLSGNSGKLLDYGCGTGLFIKYAGENGWDACGIEPSEDARKIASKHGLSVNPPSSLNSLTKKTYDVITLWHVLEHLHDIDVVIPKLKSLLNRNGLLIIAVPNINSWDAKKYQSTWAAFDVPRHLFHFSPKTIELLFAKFGMRVVNSYPMKFDSYYVSLISESKSLMAYFYAFLNGFRSNLKAKKSGNYSSLIYIIK